MKPLYVISTVFNPRRFQSRYKLYNNFAKWLNNSNVKLLTVEVAFGDRPFVITESSNPFHLQLRSRNEIWQKERALNLGLNRLNQIVPDWDYVAWCDTDIKIARDDWAEETVHLLQHYAIIQLFGEARSLGPDYHMLFHCKSIGRNFHDFGKIDWDPNPGIVDAAHIYARRGHPGLGWAFRRHELNNIGGWLDICVNGSGDLHMAACYSGDYTIALSKRASNGYKLAIKKYGDLCNKYVRRNVSYLPTAVDHFYHGKSRERGYNDRWKLLDEYKFDPYTDLLLDTQGLYKWNLSDLRVMALAVETRKSLAKRNEDTNEV